MTLSDDIKRVLELDDCNLGKINHGIIRQQNELLREAYGALKAADGNCRHLPQKRVTVALSKIKTALGDV